MELIEKVLSASNLTEACREVLLNKGAAGIDGMQVSELKPYLDKNRDKLTSIIRKSAYIPQAIRGKEIPKGNGKTRLLGIPTVIDRMLQQAVMRVIMPKYEYIFSDYSYGFRPLRNTHQAIEKSLSYIHSDYQHIVEIDLKGFFDDVNHVLLLQILYRKIKCKATMCLLRRWLRAPMQIKGKLEKRRKGVPQGSPISPLLSNILLHELDDEMQKKRIKFVRYADDFSIYCKTKSERKRKNLIRLGVKQGMAYAWSRSRMGGWAIAQSPILRTTITLKRLQKRGYKSLLDVYKLVSPVCKYKKSLFPMI